LDEPLNTQEPAVEAPTCTTERLEEVASFLAPSRQPKTGSLSRIRVIRAGCSKNRNNYSTEALGKAVPLFEGASVFYNHRDPQERDFRDLAGEIKNPRLTSDGIIGEFAPLESDVWLKSLLATSPHKVQFSIFVEAVCERNGDIVEVKEITDVVSVDIVTRAAAGGESDQDLPAIEDAKESEEAKVEDKQEPTTVDTKAEELAKVLEEKAALVKELAKVTEEKETLAKELGEIKAEAEKLAREKVLEDFIASKRESLPAASEKLFRSHLSGLQEPTAESMEAVYEEVKTLVDGIQAELALKVAPPVEDKAPVVKEEAPEAGLPPRTPEPKQESVTPKPSGREVLSAVLFG
jgi:molecular chaperone GrpE (heat shock protein)